MHEKDIRPVRDMVGFFKKQSKTGRVVFGIMFLAFWLIASVKPDGGGNGGDPGGGDGGGTNNVQMVVGQVESVKCKMENEVGALTGADSTLHFTLYTLHSSTNTTRTITGDDFRRGFVMSRVGTGEAFDFSAPAGRARRGDRVRRLARVRRGDGLDL